jgi:thiamine-monophosphate kinase
MSSESTFIGMMRAIATGAAARGLADDVAVLEFAGQTLILTQDMMVEGIHWLPDAAPEDVAWKLVSVNLSDLAAKGAKPLGVMLSFMLGDDEWDRRFAGGLSAVLAHYDVALIGGDTVGNAESKRSISMTAIGAATHLPVPSRSGAKPGDGVFVTGTLGNAKAGFDLTLSGENGPGELQNAFNRPVALIAQGQQLAPYVTAMMDISDGLLIDARHMARASGTKIAIDISCVPLSENYIALYGNDPHVRILASSWGDDYQLLFTAPAGCILPVQSTQVGLVSEGSGLSIHNQGVPVELPDTLGYQHG